MDTRQLPLIIAVFAVGLVYLYWHMNRKNQYLMEQNFYLQEHIKRLSHPIQLPTEDILLDEISSHSDTQSRDLEIIDYGYEKDSESDGTTEDPLPAVEQDGIREITEESTPAEDVVITKLSHCPHILQTGKNKGSMCGKATTQNGYCKHHEPPVPLE